LFLVNQYDYSSIVDSVSISVFKYGREENFERNLDNILLDNVRITVLIYEGCGIYCYLEITQWECIIQWCSRLPQYTIINIDKIIFTP
jgi:hypothetical protein